MLIFVIAATLGILLFVGVVLDTVLMVLDSRLERREQKEAEAEMNKPTK